MNKKTWWIIALALAIGFSLLLKNADDQPIIVEVIKFVRPSTSVVVETGSVVDTGTVATGSDIVAPEGDVVADDTVVATGSEVVAPEGDVAPEEAMPTADELMPTPEAEAEVGVEAVAQ